MVNICQCTSLTADGKADKVDVIDYRWNHVHFQTLIYCTRQILIQSIGALETKEERPVR